MMQRQERHGTQRHTETDTSPRFCFGPFFTLATLPPWSCKAEKSFSLITFKKYCLSLKPILNYSSVDMWLHYGFPKMAIDKLIGYDSSWNSTLIGTRISYTLSREYWVVRSWYSRMLFTGEDRLWPNLRVQQQSTNMTSQFQNIAVMWHPEKIVLRNSGEMSNRWLF